MIRILLIGTLLAAGLLAGCGSTPTGDRNNDQVIDDLSIQRDISKQFLEAEIPNWNSLIIRSKHGVVTLEGALPDRETIVKAVDIADSVSGVRKVNNRLRVGQR